MSASQTGNIFDQGTALQRLPAVSNAFLRHIEELLQPIELEVLALRVEVEPEELQRSLGLTTTQFCCFCEYYAAHARSYSKPIIN